MIVSNRDGLLLTSDEVLARLSNVGEVIACFVEEHVMFSSVRAAGWRQVWSVQHNAQRGMSTYKPKATSHRDQHRSRRVARKTGSSRWAEGAR